MNILAYPAIYSLKTDLCQNGEMVGSKIAVRFEIDSFVRMDPDISGGKDIVNGLISVPVPAVTMECSSGTFMTGF